MRSGTTPSAANICFSLSRCSPSCTWTISLESGTAISTRAHAFKAGTLSLHGLFRHPNVTLRTHALVKRLEHDASGRSVKRVVAERDGREEVYGADIVVVQADFYRAGDANDESFTAQMIVSTQDLAGDIQGIQNVWVQGVGCGAATVHFGA